VQITNGTNSGYITASPGGEGITLSGGEYINSSSTNVATATSATLATPNYSGFNVRTGTGLSTGNTFTATTDLYIEAANGYVGVGMGTTSPDSTLSVAGGVAIGTTYAASDAAGSNNLLVQG